MKYYAIEQSLTDLNQHKIIESKNLEHLKWYVALSNTFGDGKIICAIVSDHHILIQKANDKTLCHKMIIA